MSTDIAISGTRAVSPVGEGPRAFVAPVTAAGSAVADPAGTRLATPAQAAQTLDLARAVDDIAAHASDSGASLDFRIDEDSGRVVVSVVDRRDGTVLRQMPSEEALRIARNLARYEPHLIEARA